MNKKPINIILLLVVLVSLVSFTVNAATIADGFRSGFDRMENFFSGGWQNYERTIVFVVFFFLFYSAFLIGAKKAFGGELTRSHIVFALVAAFLSSMIIATTMRFDWINLEYVAWGLVSVLLLSLIHALLCKLGMEKHKFWAFLLALLIAALLLWLIWALMNNGRPLEGLNDVSGWFGDLGRGGGGGGGAGLGRGGDTSGGDAVTPTDGVKAGGGESKGLLRRYWWVLILAVALIYGGREGWKKWKNGGGAGDSTTSDSAGSTGVSTGVAPPEEVGALLESVKAKKEEILRKIEGVMKKIEGNEEDIVDIYKKYLQNIKKHGRVPWLRSKGSPEFRAIKKDNKYVKKLIVEQKEIEKLLIELSKLEKSLLGKIETLKGVRGIIGARSYGQLLDKLKNEIIDVLKNILVYYNVAVGELDVENKLEELFDEKHLEDRIKDKWLQLVEVKTKDLNDYFEKEKLDLRLLETNIEKENLSIDNISKLLKQKVIIVTPDDARIRQPFIVGEPIELKATVEGFEGDVNVIWNIVRGAQIPQELGLGLTGRPRIRIDLPEGNAILELKVYVNDNEAASIRKNIILEKNKVKIASDLLNEKQNSKGSVGVDDIHQALKELNVGT